MLTPEQERWIESLSSENTISIVPYNPRSEELFERVKKKIQGILGVETPVLHVGASSLGISGQDEIDVQIPVSKDKFPNHIALLETIFGEARKKHPARIRFEAREDGKKIDLALIDTDGEDWHNHMKFLDHMRNNPKDLERYRVLKEKSDGLTVKDYYRKKIEFINEILAKT